MQSSCYSHHIIWEKSSITMSIFYFPTFNFPHGNMRGKEGCARKGNGREGIVETKRLVKTCLNRDTCRFEGMTIEFNQ